MADEASPGLIDEPPVGSAKLARIGPFGNLVDANLALGRLNDEGIAASLTGEHLAAALGPIYGAAYAGGPFVLVPAADEADARRIIQSVDTTRRERLDAETPTCPNCNHRPTRRVLNGRRWAGLGLFAVAFVVAPLTPASFLIFALGVLLLAWPAVPTWKCPACRRRFAAPLPPVPEDDADDNEPLSS